MGKKKLSPYEVDLIAKATAFAELCRSDDGVCSFAMFRPAAGGQTATHNSFRNEACHAGAGGLRSYSNKHVTHMVTTLRQDGTRDTYYKYIFDKLNSPWRAVLKGSHVIKDDKGHYIGIIIKDPGNLPSDLYMNFLIATRRSWEYEASCTAFIKLVEAGVSQAYALFMMGVYNYSSATNTLTESGIGSGHSHVSPYQTDIMVYLKKAPTPKKPSIYDPNYDVYHPSHAIWISPARRMGLRDQNKSFDKALTDHLIKEYGRPPEKVEYKGAFARRRAAVNDRLVLRVPMPTNKKEARALMKAIKSFNLYS